MSQDWEVHPLLREQQEPFQGPLFHVPAVGNSNLTSFLLAALGRREKYQPFDNKLFYRPDSKATYPVAVNNLF